MENEKQTRQIINGSSCAKCMWPSLQTLLFFKCQNQEENSDISGQYAQEPYVAAQDDQTATELQCS